MSASRENSNAITDEEEQNTGAVTTQTPTPDQGE